MGDRTILDAVMEGDLSVLQPQPPPPTVGQRVQQAGSAFLEGAAGTVGLGLSGLGSILGEIPSANGGRAFSDQARAISSATPEIMRQSARETIPPVAGLEDSFLNTTVPGAVGSTAAFLGVGAVGGAAELPKWLGAAAAGAAVNGAAGYHEALLNGATDSDAWKSFALNAAVGTSEALEIGRLFSRVNKASGGALRRILVDGVVEGSQEVGQQVASNLIAQNLYDEDRKALDGMVENGGAGFLTGILFGATAEAVSRKGVQTEQERGANGEPVAAPASAPAGPDSPARTWAKEFLGQRGVKAEFAPLPEGVRAAYTGKGAVTLSDALSDEDTIRATVLHETVHELATARGETFQELRDAIKRSDPEGFALHERRYNADFAAQVGGEQAGDMQPGEEATARYTEEIRGYLMAAIEGKTVPKPGILRSLADAVVRVLQKLGVKIDTSTEKRLREFAVSPWESRQDPKRMQAIAADIAKAFEQLANGVDVTQTTPASVASPEAASPPSAPPATATPEAGAGGVFEAQPPAPEPTTAAPVETLTQGERAATPPVEEQHAKLRAMASVAGWEQEGGKAFLSTMAERDPGQDRGRQKWVARDPWWDARPEHLRLNETQTKRAVNRYIAGEKLTPKEQKFIDWMLSYEEAPAAMDPLAMLDAADAAAEREAIQNPGENTLVEGVPFAVEPRKIIGYDLTGEPIYEEKPKAEKPTRPVSKETQGGLFTPKQKQAFGLGDTEVEKPRGKYAVAPREDSPEFKRWFGESKVVDNGGKPLVVYHGTSGPEREFTKFDVSKIGSKTDHGYLGSGFYFSDEPSIGGIYAGAEGFVMPVYLSMQSPLELWQRRDPSQTHRAQDSELHIKNWLNLKNDATSSDVRNALLSNGYDGVIFHFADARSFRDKSKDLTYEFGDTEYVALHPEQIKSATGNRGTYDPTNSDIRFAVAPSGDFTLPDDTRRRAFTRALLDSFEALRLSPTLDRAISLRSGLAYGKAERIQAQTVRGMIDIARKVGQEKADEFLYALHAPTRNAIIAGRTKGTGAESNPGSGMRTSEAQRIVAEGLKNPDLVRLRDLNRRLNRERLDTLEASGLLSADQRKAWETFGEDYVPLRTLDDPESQYGSGSLNVTGPESKRAEGRSTRADSPMIFGITSLAQAIERAERNKVGNRLAEFVRANPSSEWGIYPTLDAVPEAWRKDGILSTKENGKPVYIATSNAEVASAFKQMDVAKATGVMKAAMLFRRYMHNVIIKYNPAFSVSNAFRDIGTASAKLVITDSAKAGAKVARYAPGAMRGSWAAIRDEKAGGEWGRWYREARDSGALVGWNELSSFQDVKDALRSGKRQAILAAIENANRGIELGTRVAVYRTMVEEGKSAEEAATITRDATTDFARRGNYSSQLSALYLFFNANVQGTASLWKAMAKNPVRGAAVVGSMAAVGYLLSVASRMYGDDWDKITEQTKRRQGGVMLGDTLYGVPLPYGFDVFYYIGQRLESEINGGHKSGTIGSDILSSVLQSFSPMQGADVLQAVTPTVARPFVEIAENKDFAGIPIRPLQSPFDRTPTPRSEQAFASVDPRLKALAQGMNRATGGDSVRPGVIDVSPEDIEHLLRFMGGGAGSFVQRIVTATTKAIEGEPVRASDVPILRTFMAQIPESAVARIYYDNLTAIERETEAKKAGEETRDPKALSLSAFARNVDRRVKRLREMAKKDPEREKELRATMREAMEQLNMRMMQP